MNVSLTDDLRDFVELQVSEHSFTSTSEYVRSLLRRERDIATMRATILAGAAGPRSPMDDAYFDSLRSVVAGQGPR